MIFQPAHSSSGSRVLRVKAGPTLDRTAFHVMATHTHTQIHTLTYTHICTHTLTHTHTDTRIHTHLHNSHSHTLTHTLTHSHTLSLSHTHTHPDWDSADTPVRLTCTSSGCQREPENLEKIHADMRRSCVVLHTCGRGLSGLCRTGLLFLCVMLEFEVHGQVPGGSAGCTVGENTDKLNPQA